MQNPQPNSPNFEPQGDQQPAVPTCLSSKQHLSHYTTPQYQQPRCQSTHANPQHQRIQPQQLSYPRQVALEAQPLLRGASDVPPPETFNLGGMSNFVVGLVAGFFLPILSLVLACAMKATQLTKLGAITGWAIACLWAASYLFANAILFVLADVSEWTTTYLYPAIPLFTLGICLVVVANTVWQSFLGAYSHPQAADIRVHHHRHPGTTRHFWCGFLGSLFCPIIGTALLACCGKTLRTRFGAWMGAATFFFLVGVASIFVWWMSIFTGNPLLLVGLFIFPLATVHFTRAIVGTELAILPPLAVQLQQHNSNGVCTSDC